MSLERQPVEKVIKQTYSDITLNIVDINRLRSEIPGSPLAHVEDRQEWSPVTQGRKSKRAPAVIKLTSIKEVDKLIDLCKTDKKNGVLRLPEVIFEKAS